MQTKSIRHPLIAKLAALALLALCFIQSDVRALQPSNISAARSGVFTLTFNGQTTGLARGQTLRITVPNGNEQESRSGSLPVRAQATLFDAQGNPVDQSPEVEIPPGEFRSIDFDRDDLPLAGEQGTGRLEVRSQIRYRFLAIVDRTQLSPPSEEIIDMSSGMTTIAYRANDRLRTAGPTDASLGITPGQTLRVTMFNSSEPGSPESAEPIRAHVKVFDAYGTLIAESSEALIAAGEFHSFDFNRSDLRLAGEPGTNRAQFRTQPLWSARAGIRLGPDDIPASVEIVDNGTGRTIAATSTMPKEIVVVGP